MQYQNWNKNVISKTKPNNFRTKKKSNPKDKEGMARFGINSKYALGVRIPVLRAIAKRHIKDPDRQVLALQLWKTNIHEARILASMVADPKKITEKLMDEWVIEFNSWDLCDQCCMNLFDKTEFAEKKIFEWVKDEKEFIRRAGFALIACVAWHRKDWSDQKFDMFFPLIEKYSYDKRNFVRKAVNWALRQIGKKNKNLNKKAIECAHRILKQETKTAKWIASDAIRELESKKKIL
ncbi:MAG: DNA alkylation repair protein [Candidatus Woesearchaeota archaeon]